MFDALGFPRVGTAAELAVFHDAIEFRKMLSDSDLK